jgi:hypothetical protein
MTTPTLSPTAVAVWGIESGDVDNLRRLRDFRPAEDETDTFAAQCRILAAHLLELPNLKDFYTSNATAASLLAMTQAKNAELERRVEGAEDEIVHLRATNASLKNDLDLAKGSLALIQRLTPATAPAATAPERSVKIPDPPSFAKGRKEYRAFKAKLEHKLSGDAHLFRDARHQLTYAVGFVTDEAYETVRPLLREMESVAQLIAHLDSTYEDPDPQGTAERELRALKQGTSDFSAHYAKFQGIMAILGWEGSARQSALYNSLSQDLKETLARTIPQPDETFAQYVAKVRVLDDQLRRLAAESKGKSSGQSSGKPAPRQSYSPNPVDSTGATSHKGPAPMDLSMQKRLEAKQAKYEEWAAQGVCTKCGSDKHWRKECPLNQPPRKKLAAAATSTTTTDPAGASNSPAPSSSQSGKE